MSKHAAPKPPRPARPHFAKPFLWTGAGVLALALAIWFWCFGGLQALTAALPAGTTEVSEAESEAASSEPDSAEEPESQENSGGDEEPTRVSMPAEELRGAWLCAGTEYDVSGKGDADAIRKELSAAIGQLKSWGFNTVLLPLQKQGKALYAAASAQSADNAFDPIAYAAALARGENMHVYGVLDLSAAGDLTAADGAEKAAALAAEAAACPVDGVWLTGYTTDGAGDTAAYMAAGGGDRPYWILEKRRERHARTIRR